MNIIFPIFGRKSPYTYKLISARESIEIQDSEHSCTMGINRTHYTGAVATTTGFDSYVKMELELISEEEFEATKAKVIAKISEQ